MRKFLIAVVMMMMVCCLSGCSLLIPMALIGANMEEYETEPEVTLRPEIEMPTIKPPTIEVPTSPIFNETDAEETTTQSMHSEYYIPGVDVDMLIRYFSEVVLDAEYSGGGNSSLVQKWDCSVKYYIHGNPTETDLMYIEDTVDYVNSIYGFPGMEETRYEHEANLQIHFVGEDELLELMGDNFQFCDGAVTYWYDDYNVIYDEIICYRNDIEQYTRNSVIIEEIYNGLGPVQDTTLRPNSIIYSGFSTPQEMTQIDELILKILYHPDIRCGMDDEECARVIRKLYY